MWNSPIKHAAWLVRCNEDVPTDIIKVRCDAANTIKRQWDANNRLQALLKECVERFRLYEMDVDDEPPHHHNVFVAKIAADAAGGKR